MTDTPASALRVTLGKNTCVHIGEPQDGNLVEIAIENTCDRELKVLVEVRIPVGSGEKDLLHDVHAHIDVKIDPDVPLHKSSGKNGETFFSSWKTPQRPVAALKLAPTTSATVTLSSFCSNTPPGNPQIEFVICVYEDAKWSNATIKSLQVAKLKSQSAGPNLHYFFASPALLLHAGDATALSFCGSGYASYALKRNNRIVQTWQPKAAGELCFGTYNDTPSFTSIYELHAQKGDTKSADDAYGQRTVQVVAPGWNALQLPQGYPTQLFVHDDFTEDGGKRLYGIFVEGEKARLWSSATGIDDWRCESDTVPRDMAASPGVAFDDKLWLIGGSSYDLNARSDQVWCYERTNPDDDDDRSRDWVEKTGLELPEARMGHACIVVPNNGKNEIWVIGGCKEGPDRTGSVVYANDVLVLRDQDWNMTTACNDWEGRRMHSVAVTRTSRTELEIWLYGGIGVVEKTHADGTTGVREVLLSDLWCRQHGNGGWTRSPGLVPSPGAPLGCALFTAPRVRYGDPQRLLLAGTFVQPAEPPVFLEPTTQERPSATSVSRILVWNRDRRIWDAEEVSVGWQRFGGYWFRMNGLSFNGFSFVWSLHREVRRLQPPPALNVYIPS